MPCEKHDELAAGKLSQQPFLALFESAILFKLFVIDVFSGSQFVTHLTGRALATLGLKGTPIDTQGFKSLLNIIDGTTKDSWDLFSALYQYNNQAKEQLQQLIDAYQQTSFKLQSLGSNEPQLYSISSRIAQMQPSVTAQVNHAFDSPSICFSKSHYLTGDRQSNGTSTKRCRCHLSLSWRA
jgi:hypothetical protein